MPLLFFGVFVVDQEKEGMERIWFFGLYYKVIIQICWPSFERAMLLTFEAARWYLHTVRWEIFSSIILPQLKMRKYNDNTFSKKNRENNWYSYMYSLHRKKFISPSTNMFNLCQKNCSFNLQNFDAAKRPWLFSNLKPSSFKCISEMVVAHHSSKISQKSEIQDLRLSFELRLSNVGGPCKARSLFTLSKSHEDDNVWIYPGTSEQLVDNSGQCFFLLSNFTLFLLKF